MDDSILQNSNFKRHGSSPNVPTDGNNFWIRMLFPLARTESDGSAEYIQAVAISMIERGQPEQWRREEQISRAKLVVSGMALFRQQSLFLVIVVCGESKQHSHSTSEC
jgi:hypothetical protein